MLNLIVVLTNLVRHIESAILNFEKQMNLKIPKYDNRLLNTTSEMYELLVRNWNHHFGLL